VTRRPAPFDQLLAIARRHSRSRDEAEDLVQSACLAAIATGRRDFGDAQVMAWLAGTLRNLGAMDARGAARRRQREAEFVRRVALTTGGALPLPDPAGLPPALARTARLIAAGCTRDELRWLLGISDTALRQRLSTLRRVARAADTSPVAGTAMAPRGPARPALLTATRRVPSATVGSHDPDGNLFVIGPSQSARRRQQEGEQ
jgi:DNA-directed RNA polymerase specialized sigma24 family protein